jgi:RNA polymerase sigma-70 factor (ECF subfamily)
MDFSDAAVRLHRAQLVRYLRRRTSSDEAAEDLTQDVLAAAVANLAKLDTDRPLLAWLYRVARNRLIDEVRANERRPQLVPLDEASEQDSERAYAPLLAAAIRRASLRLEIDDREILGARLFAEEPFVVIAERLGIAEPAARMRYVRALRRLRHELEEEGVERD